MISLVIRQHDVAVKWSMKCSPVTVYLCLEILTFIFWELKWAKCFPAEIFAGILELSQTGDFPPLQIAESSEVPTKEFQLDMSSIVLFFAPAQQ